MRVVGGLRETKKLLCVVSFLFIHVILTETTGWPLHFFPPLVQERAFGMIVADSLESQYFFGLPTNRAEELKALKTPTAGLRLIVTFFKYIQNTFCDFCLKRKRGVLFRRFSILYRPHNDCYDLLLLCLYILVFFVKCHSSVLWCVTTLCVIFHAIRWLRLAA